MAPARIYLLEDDPERIISLARTLRGPIQGSQTCERAHEFSGAYNLILLDHDLGGRQMSTHEDNGYTFLKRVFDRIHLHSRIVIHSHNPDGARLMQQLLAAAEWRDSAGYWTQGHPDVHRAEFGSPQFKAAIKPWTDGEYVR